MAEKNEKAEEKIKQVISLMEFILNDTSIPKNVRKAVGDAREKLNAKDDLIVRTSGAIYALDEVSNDINMPAHARTQIWTIVSALESIRE
ncbi:Uncharacterised protein [uncultured archaeon]|nr:Uncharacterised protein [uncultured archaeon]